MLEGKKVLVLGMAKSGLAASRLLNAQNQVIVTDQKEQPLEILKELEDLNVSFKQSKDARELLDASFDLLVKSPGIVPSHPCVQKARELNIPVVNEMELAYHYLPKDVTIIGITGSNGKTTTTTILYDLLRIHNLPAILGGNIGYPLCEVLKDVNKNSILVLEISDHQLYDFKDFKTNYSILTNLYPTHLDFHGNYENYINVKKKIFNHHTSLDKAYLNYQNFDSLKITEDIKSTKYYFNNKDNYYNDEGIFINNELVLKLDEIKIKGKHNYENVLAALLVLKEFAWDLDKIKNYFRNFNGVEHRLEIVDSKRNIAFFNDSKATNPTSTLMALRTLNGKVNLILGGKERSQDFNELNEEIKKVIKIYAIGEVEDRVEDYARKMNIPWEKCGTLERAMQKIKEDVRDGEIVLLSPASASWDQYDKFETRGNEFKKLVEKLFD